MRVLRKEDILAILKVLVDLKDGRGEIDDIDHLGNRRVRSVGELMENQYRLGLLRMERAIRERMSSVEIDTVMPHDLINAKPAAAAVREFFGSSQLVAVHGSDQSAVGDHPQAPPLGPRAGRSDARARRLRGARRASDALRPHLPDRDAGRPEYRPDQLARDLCAGQPIRLHRKPLPQVVDGKVTDEVVYLSAMEEGRYTIAQANATLDAKGKLIKADLVNCRKGGDFVMARPQDIDFIDVSPKQLVSVAAALIPFLENDDANRALMGSNMQRQAVPLIRAEAPLVGTGMERPVARDSGVDHHRAPHRHRRSGRRHPHRRPRHRGDLGRGAGRRHLQSAEVPALEPEHLHHPASAGEGGRRGARRATSSPTVPRPSSASWRSAATCSSPSCPGTATTSRIRSSSPSASSRDDVFTSIHIEEFEVMARDTKLGQEEITRDIPNVGEEALKNLDEAGIVYIGAEVKPGDILVGKVTPKGESPMTPEEKLLRAIFGEKASDVRDTSLRLPPGVSGTIVEVRVFSRRGVDKDERALAIERAEIERLAKDRDDEKAILERSFYARLKGLLIGQEVASGPRRAQGRHQAHQGRCSMSSTRQSAGARSRSSNDKRMAEIEALKKQMDDGDRPAAEALRETRSRSCSAATNCRPA